MYINNNLGGDDGFPEYKHLYLFQNASGVLVYDNEDVSVLQSMKVEWFKIPSVFTYNWKGKEIVELIRTYGKIHLGFSKGSHCRTETVTRLSDDDGASDANTDEATVASTTSLTKILYCVPPDAWNGFQVSQTSHNLQIKS